MWVNAVCGLHHWNRCCDRKLQYKCTETLSTVGGNAREALTVESVNQHPSSVTLDMRSMNVFSSPD